LRKIFYISVATGVACLILAALAFLQIPVQKVKTVEALRVLEAEVRRTPRAEGELPKQLEYAISDIRWNDHALRATHSVLWALGVFGFLAVAVSQFVVAFLARSAPRTNAVGRPSQGAEA